MAAGGGERVTLSLLSMPQMGVKAYIIAIPVTINKMIKTEIYQNYLADALRIIGENVARYSGGGYIKERYIDIIGIKPKVTRTSEEIIKDISDKLVKMGGELP